MIFVTGNRVSARVPKTQKSVFQSFQTAINPKMRLLGTAAPHVLKSRYSDFCELVELVRPIPDASHKRPFGQLLRLVTSRSCIEHPAPPPENILCHEPSTHHPQIHCRLRASVAPSHESRRFCTLAVPPRTVAFDALSPSAALASASLEFCTAGRNKSLPSIRIEFGHRATFGNHACSRTPGVCPVHPCCKIRRTRQNGRPFCRNRYPARPAIHGQSTTSLLQNPSILQHESVCRLPPAPVHPAGKAVCRSAQLAACLIPWIPHFRWLCWRLDRSGSPFPRNGSLTTELEPRNYSGLRVRPVGRCDHAPESQT